MAVKTTNLEIDLDSITTGSTLDANKKNALSFLGKTYEDLSGMTATIENKNLILSYSDKTITVKNYTGIKYFVTTDKVTDIISNGFITNNVNFNQSLNIKNGVVNDLSKYSDIISASSLANPIKVIKDKQGNITSKIGVTIKSGDGNDTITGSSFNDTITAGKGENTLDYSSYTGDKAFGDDTINLTKGETLNITGLDFTDIDADKRFTQGSNKNDLLVTTKYGTITLKNYLTKELGATVTITSTTPNETINLSNDGKMEVIGVSNYFAMTGQKVKAKYTGTALADRVDGANLETPTAVKKIKGEEVKIGVTVNTGAGNDVITSSKFNDTITAGIGQNTIDYTGFESEFGDDVINLTKGETLNLTLTGLTAAYSKGKNANDLLITTEKGTITLKNYLTKNLGAEVIVNGTNLNKIPLSINTSTVTSEGAFKNGKFQKTTALADSVDASGLTTAIKTTKDKKGNIISETGVTINTGFGDDKITGSKFNDTITGGVGTNTIIIKNETFGVDTINLTKDENLILDLSAYTTITSADDLKGKVKVNGANLEINLGNGTIILKNYGKSDVTGLNGSVKVKLSNSLEVDLSTADILTYDSSSFKNGKFAGSRFGETIDATNIYRNANISGGAGYNNITGTNGFNDVITGGNDGNKIVAGNGNKTITTGSGNDIISVTGSGTHTVKTGNGINTVTISGSGKTTVTGGGEADTILIGQNSDVTNINAGNGRNNITVSNSGNNTIVTGVDDDTITINGNTSTTNIKAGAGENTIVINNSEAFGNIILNEEKKNAVNVIKFTQDISSYAFLKENKNLVIKDENSSIIINDYFQTRTDKTKFADITFKIGDTLYTIPENKIKELQKGLIEGDNEANTLYGSSTNDKIYGRGGNDTIYGGAGNDVIEGNEDNDIIYGEAGNDKIFGNEGNDSLFGGEGNDTISGGSGSDTINGGLGTNIINFNIGDGEDIIEDGKGVDTLVFDKSIQLTKDNFKYVNDADLVITYSDNDKITLKDYTTDHSVKYIQIGNSKKSIENYLPEPKTFEVAGANLVTGTDNADNLKVVSNITNRIFAADGNDTITTAGSQWNTSYIYGGKGDDTITSGIGQDIIFGGGGENTIIFAKGSGANQIEGEGEHNTIVFSDLGSLDNLKFTMGEQNAYMYISDLYISGYGNNTDSVKITSFFNLEGYDYSKYIVKDKNGNSDTLYNLLSKSDIKNKYFTGTYKARHNAVTTSPAQRTTQIDSVIYGNTPGIANHNVIVGAGGNNTYYSGGYNTGAAGSGQYGYTMIYGGNGDETFHAEGDRIYFNNNGTLETHNNVNSVYIVTKTDGTKEVKQGLFYRTPIANETPYMAQLDVYDEHDPIYYTEDPDKIAILLADAETYGIQGVGLIGDGTNGIAMLEVISSYAEVLNGGNGNDTFYTSSGGEGGDGNDIFYGSGTMEGGQGDDKFIFKEDYELNKADTWYGASTNSGNDFIDTTKITTVLNNPISIRFGEGVNTIKVDGKNNVNIFVDTTSTYEEENTEMFIETKDLGTDSNVHFTAFEKDGKLYIASNNGRGAGTLIIEGWGGLTPEQKDKLTITYKESHEWIYSEKSTYTLREFLNVINQEGDLFEGEGYTNGAHKYDMGEGLTVRKKETYTFNVIDNSNGTLSTINENGTTVTADRNVYNDNQEITGTTNKIVDYYIIGGTGSQTIKGGDGNDVIFGDNINGHNDDGNYIYSTNNDGADTIHGGKGNDYIIGGAGNDRINGGSGKDYIDGGDGDDTLIGGTVDIEDLDNTQFNYKELHGGAGNDIIYSTEETEAYAGGDKYFRNNIYGEDGDDTIYANGYNDVVYGGVGDDEIHSYKNKQNGYYNSNASSLIYGGKGDDRIYLYGDAEQIGVYAVQEVYGEEGNDLIDARGSSSHNKIDGGAGSDTIYAGSGGDSISGGYGDDVIYGGDGDDDLYGGDGLSDSDIIYGGKGNDTISALGSSKIYGEDGNDTIYFATGKRLAPSNLYIDGGAGDDTYVTDQSGYGYDTIVASAGKDTIRIADFDYQSERFGKSSYTYNGDDLVLTLNHMGYMSGLFLKDYKKGGFENFSVVTTSDSSAKVMTGKYTITQFLDYLDGKDIYVSNGTNGNDMIRSTGNIDGKGGDDIIIANSSTSTEEAPQIVITGSGNNAVVLNSNYTNVTGGTGNDSYTMVGANSTIVDADGNNNVVRASSDGGTYNITFNGDGNNTVTDNTFYWANYNINSTGNGKLTVNISEYAQAKVNAQSGSADDEFNVGIGDVNIDAGDGNNKIVLTDGSAKAGSGNDIYTVNYKYATQVFIEDTQGVNTLTINDKIDHGEGTGATPPITHSDYNIFFNVDKNGNDVNFSFHDEDYNVDVDNVGYSTIITTDKMDYYRVAKAFGTCTGNNDDGFVYSIQDYGIRMTGNTLNSFSQINIDDGYSLNITKENMDAIRQSIANWLTSDGRDYADAQAACSVGDTALAQANFTAISGLINDNLNWIQNV